MPEQPTNINMYGDTLPKCKHGQPIIYGCIECANAGWEAIRNMSKEVESNPKYWPPDQILILHLESDDVLVVKLPEGTTAENAVTSDLYRRATDALRAVGITNKVLFCLPGYELQILRSGEEPKSEREAPERIIHLPD